jgi:hypothetical protein
MKNFQITAKFTTYCTVEILAEDENDAYLKAKEMDGGDFEPHAHGEWEIDKVQEVAPVLTPEQLAFIDAYGDSVADATREEIVAFFVIDDADAFCDRYGTGTYSSIMDACCIWNRAMDFVKAIEKNN